MTTIHDILNNIGATIHDIPLSLRGKEEDIALWILTDGIAPQADNKWIIKMLDDAGIKI